MGVNRVGFGIIDDEVVKEASRQEIIRRYFSTTCDFKKGLVDEDTLYRMKLLLEEVNLKEEDRTCVEPARSYAKKLHETLNTDEQPAVLALELPDKRIITGRGSSLMECCAAALLNATKVLAEIEDPVLLLSPEVIKRIQDLKENNLYAKKVTLSANEVLIALSICAVNDTQASKAYQKLPALFGSQAHCTVMLTKDNEQILKKLGIDVTCDPVYPSENLYY